MKKSFKKIFCTLLSLIMICTMLPYGSIIAYSGDTIKGAPETVEINTGSGSNKREQNINDGWKFNMTTADCSASTYNDSAWSNVQLPHDFSIYQNFTTSGEAESGFLPGGTGWYRKKLVIPAEKAGKRFELNFDGAYMHTYVYVNGSYVGENHYGYNSFAFDITDKLTCDGNTENVIAVKVVHNTPSSRWYSGSGIYRNVTLITTDKVHIAHNGLTITTPNISSGNGTVNAVAKVKNEGSSTASVSVKASIFEKGSESVVATATSTGTVSSNSTSNITITPVVSSPKLWSLDNPNLYIAKIEVSINGSVVDTYEDQFGFRYFDWSRTNGFSLNGARVQLQGVCMHHDQGALGSAAYYDAMYRQMENMKNMGVNAIRATHNPYSEDFYKICDELGLLVIEELFDGWAWAKNGNSNDFSSQWNVNLTASNTVIGGSSSMTWPEFVTKEVCQRDVNRPSVFMWSICNELFEGANGGVSTAETYAQNIINWIKSVDTTRKYTSGDNNIKNGNSYYIAVDRVIANNGGIVGLNYCDSTQYSSIYNNNSSWIFYGAETASTTNTRAMYKGLSSNSSADSNRHITSYDTSAVGWGKTANDSMFTTLSNTFLAGEFRWTGWDYIGEPTPWNGTGTGQVSGGNGATPNSSYFGIVDTAGFEKDTYYLYRSQWNDKTDKITTHLVTAWDSDNYYVSGGKTPVFIYSNAAKVELYLRKNNSNTDTLMGTATRKDGTTSVGAKYHQYNTTSNNSSECTATALNNSSGTSLYARFDLTYNDGTLFTKSYDSNGNLISNDRIEGRHTVSTAGNVSKAKITANKTEITADGESLAYFTIDLLDSNNNLVTTGQNQIKFDITGNGEIMGVDNGDEATTQKFQQSSVIDINNRTTAKIYSWGGKALVIVRSTNNAGQFTVTASSPSSEFTPVSASVNTVDDGDNELTDGDINSITYIRNYTVKRGTAPTFDTSVSATVVGNNDTINGNITWNSVSSDIYNMVGDYTINGTANINGQTKSVSCTLHVVETVNNVRNISTVTIPGVIPELPGTINGLLANGELSGEFEVEWDALTSNMFTQSGSIVEIDGTASCFGEDVAVKAYVRVVEPNVKTTYDITDTAYITSNVQTGEISALRDNNLNQKAWSNEDSSTVSDKAYVQFRWDTAVQFSGFEVAYNISGKAAEPEDVEIQYSTNDQDYESVGYVGPVEEIVGNKLYNYALDESINPTSVRIIFTQQMRTTGENYVALNELKAYSDNKSTPTANDSALLSNIAINGTTIDGFKSSKLSYPSITVEVGNVVTATSDDNAAITVLPINNGSVKIVTLSEDGKTSKIYNIGSESRPAPEYSNISSFATVTGSHSMSTSYDVIKDGRTGYDGNNSSYSENGKSGLNNLNSWGWRSTNTAPFDIIFAFDKAYDINQIKAYFWSDSGGTKPPSKFEILYSNDGSSFSTYATYTERSSNSTPESNKLPPISNLSSVTPCTFDVDIKDAKAIKVIAYQTGTDAVGYAEVEINGAESYTANPVNKDETVYTFSGTNTTFDGNNTPYLFTDNTNSTYLTGAQWGSTSSSNSNGYINVDNATITSVKSSNKVTSGDAISGVNGDDWSISMKYQYNYNDNASVTLFGIGSHNSVSTQSNGQTQDASYMTNGRFGADLIYVCKDGGVYINGSSTATTTISDVQSSNIQIITFKYESGTIKVLIDDAEKASIDVSTNKDKFEAGPGNFFVGTSAANLAGGTWHYLGRSNTGNAIHSFKLYEIKAIKTTITQPEPVDPEEPDFPQEDKTPVLNADTTAIDSAMSAFETKINSGTIYTNLYNAYTAYVNCQKARDTAKYGNDSSVDLNAKAEALQEEIGKMNTYSFSYTGSNLAQKFSSSDNIASNYTAQYFKSALHITADEDPCAVYDDQSGWIWFGFYMHKGTYIYDGTNDIHVPVMLNIQPKSSDVRIYGAYLQDQQDGVTLGRKWFGSDGSGSDRIYWRYENYTVLKNANSGYGNRSFTIPATSNYSESEIFKVNGACSTSLGGGGTSANRSGWNLYTTNYINVDGSKVFTDQKTASTTLNLGNLVVDQAKDDTISTIGNRIKKAIPSYNNKGQEIVVINYKGVKDRVQSNMNKFNSVNNYKEGGLNWSASGVTYFTDNLSSINAGSHGVPTYVGYINTVHSRFNSADSSSQLDSSDYADLRTALDNASIVSNDNCYDSAKFEVYVNARNAAIEAMKNIYTNGYVTSYNSKSIGSIASALSAAKTELTNSNGSHNFGTGIYNPSTKQITYICKTNPAHKSIIDASAYIAALDELNAKIEDVKYKTQAVKNAQYVLDASSIISGDTVNGFITEDDINAITTVLSSAKTDFDRRVNIKRFDVTYSYQKNNDVIGDAQGLIVDARYGDWLVDSGYTLDESETVYKWTIEDEAGGIRTRVNTTTNYNVYVNSDMNLICYITDGTEEARAGQHKVIFKNFVGKVAGIEYISDQKTLTVEENNIKDESGNILFTANKPPYYNIVGFKAGGKIYKSGDVITIDNDTTIQSVYEASQSFKIYTTGSVAGNATINGEKGHSGNASFAYTAIWDEKIELHYISSGSRDVYWFINGKLSGYGEYLYFRATSDAVITAEISIDLNVPTVFMDYFTYNAEENKVTTVTTFYSASKEIVETGVILSTRFSDIEDIKQNGRKFVANKYTDGGNQAKISVTRTATNPFDMYALPYITVNIDGVYQTYYADTVSHIKY